MKITSTAFEHMGMIPSKYTCDGMNITPPLNFSDIPEETRSLVLICDDPDAPSGTFVHWLVYNIPSDISGFAENTGPEELAKHNILQGRNSFGRLDYGGPCPPDASHRYFFKLYALNSSLKTEEGLTKKELLEIIDPHIIEMTELIGMYHRQ